MTFIFHFRSYLCADVGHLELTTVLRYPDSPPGGTKLTNTTVIGKKVQFDAFRDRGTVLPGFRVSGQHLTSYLDQGPIL